MDASIKILLLLIAANPSFAQQSSKPRPIWIPQADIKNRTDSKSSGQSSASPEATRSVAVRTWEEDNRLMRDAVGRGDYCGAAALGESAWVKLNSEYAERSKHLKHELEIASDYLNRTRGLVSEREVRISFLEGELKRIGASRESSVAKLSLLKSDTILRTFAEPDRKKLLDLATQEAESWARMEELIRTELSLLHEDKISLDKRDKVYSAWVGYWTMRLNLCNQEHDVYESHFNYLRAADEFECRIRTEAAFKPDGQKPIVVPGGPLDPGKKKL